MQQILPAVRDFRMLEKFIQTDNEYGIIIGFRLSQLKQAIRMLHQNKQKAIVHLDLVKGLENSEDGANFLIEEFRTDGIISTHPQVIQVAKKQGVISILRIFIIDSQSLAKSIRLANSCQPDYIEILPGYAYPVIHKMRQHTDIALIAGGLIDNQTMVQDCIDAGLVGVTTGNPKLW